MNRLLVVLLLLSPLMTMAQGGHKIDLRVSGLKDTTAYLGYFLQEKTFVRDTARAGSDGSFSFEGADPLAQGIYFLVVNKNRLFDFIVADDQHFALATSTEDYNGEMKVSGDEDNTLFFENLRFSSALSEEAEPLLNIVRDSARTEDQKEKARAAIKGINEKMVGHQESVIAKHPNSLTARLLKMNKPIVIPDPPKLANGTIDSTFQLRYYRKHYFDNFDLGDEALLRVPKVFYWEKVQDYLNRLFIQHPDTISRVIDELAGLAKKNRETYKYLVWNCIVNYMSPEIMGMDQVFVNLVDRYITGGEMDYWLDKKTIQNLKNEADKIRRARIGSIAPDMMMQNENLEPRSLYDLKSRYTIIFFFKPTCSHCREEAPKLVAFYNANKEKYDLGVFAVATDTSMREMKEFIRDFKTPWITVNGPRTYLKTHYSEQYYADQTPMIYITDEKKKIIARKLPVDQIGPFLANYEKFHHRR